MKEALESSWRIFPCPAVLGRICPHGCEDACRRCEVDEPGGHPEPETPGSRSSSIPERSTSRALPKRDEKVAIIGSGPAGLSAAYHLARQGIMSTIFEALPQAGRHAAGGHSGAPAAQECSGPGNRNHHQPGGGDQNQHRPGTGLHASTICLAGITNRCTSPSAPTRASAWAFPVKRPRVSARAWISEGSQPDRQNPGRRKSGHHRRRQCGHRCSPLRRAHGRRRGDHHLPQNPHGNAGLGRGDRGRRS
jgi:hypothetical protein